MVTGGSRGIGAATCRLAAARGWDVAVGYHSERDAAEAVVDECRAGGAQALSVQLDIAEEAGVARLFAEASRLGPVTGLVSNAGSVPSRQRIEDVTSERIDHVLAVNLRGALLCAREAVRRMAPRNGGMGGAIVHVTSRAAVLGGVGEWVDYAAAKAGMDTLTVGLAQEVIDDGIRVNAVRPGLVDTDFHARAGEAGRVDRISPSIPIGRAGRPPEVAAAIVWLLSDEASYVTGAVLDVSGGR